MDRYICYLKIRWYFTCNKRTILRVDDNIYNDLTTRFVDESCVIRNKLILERINTKDIKIKVLADIENILKTKQC